MVITLSHTEVGEILTRTGIIKLLDSKNVPWQRWGNGTCRTVDDLCHYHHNDRLHFRSSGTDEFVIDVHAVIVMVLYKSRKGWLELYEDRQVFPDGHVLQRTCFNGIAETLKRTASSLQSEAERCLAEELQFHDPSKYTLSECLRIETREPVPSEKWLGVMAAYHRYIFECVISRALYNPEGYVEQEDNRTIFFKWKPRGQMQLGL